MFRNKKMINFTLRSEEFRNHMQILVTGANGQLGRELQLEIPHSDIRSARVVAVDSAHCDIVDRQAVERLVGELHPDVIINCAAYTAVDRAEAEPDRAKAVNCTGAANLADAARRHDALMIHISTDYVFDGTRRIPYTEADNPSPINVYGRTKLAGERAVSESGCRNIIIRTQWLYSPFGHNFMKTMLELARHRDRISVVCDQYGSPTTAADLARAIVKILSDSAGCRDIPCGIYNFASAGQASWYDFAKAIFELSGSSVELLPIPTSEYPTAARRPQFSVLDTSLIRNRFGVTTPDWHASLAETLRRLGDPENIL